MECLAPHGGRVSKAKEKKGYLFTDKFQGQVEQEQDDRGLAKKSRENK